MSKPIAEMTEEELYTRVDELYQQRGELVKQLREIDEEAYQIEYRLMGGV